MFFPFLVRCIKCEVLNKILTIFSIDFFELKFCVEIFSFQLKNVNFYKIFS